MSEHQNGAKPSFSFVSGRHHGPESWEYVYDELTDKGYDCLVHDLPIENDWFTTDDHARLITNEERKARMKRIWRVGWSWGANVIPRLTDRSDVEGLIYVAGAFYPETIRSKVRGHIPRPEHSVLYSSMEVNPSREAFEEMARDVFYNGIENPERVNRAVHSLRRHERRKKEPQLAPYPDHLHSAYIALTMDRALKPDYQFRVADLLGIKVVERMEAGHGVMISAEKAKKLASKLIRLANYDYS